MSTRTVNKVIDAVAKSEGAGARVRRSIGVPGMYTFSPFLMLDHFYGGEKGFPAHPHLAINTVTLVRSNCAIMHEDFTGNAGILYQGDLQFMTAGKGIVHSEMPVPTKAGIAPEGMQLWVDSPIDKRKCEPSYFDLRSYEIEEGEDQDGKLKVKVILGEAYGAKGESRLPYTPFTYYNYTLKPGTIFEQKFPNDFNVFLYLIEGTGLRLADGTTVKEHQNAFFNTDGDIVKGANPITNDNDVEFVLIGGQILDQPTFHYGPFVGDSEQDLRNIINDYSYQRNAFAPLKTWNSLVTNGVTDEVIEKLGGQLERDKKKDEYLAKKRELLRNDVKDEY